MRAISTSGSRPVAVAPDFCAYTTPPSSSFRSPIFFLSFCSSSLSWPALTPSLARSAPFWAVSLTLSRRPIGSLLRVVSVVRESPMLRRLLTDEHETWGRELLRLAEVVALRAVAAEVDQPLSLVLGLHALSAHHLVERMCHVDGGGDDGVVGSTATESLDEHAVDLQLVEREAAQVRERRAAGAEVVDGQLHADVLERTERVGGRIEVVEQRTLRHLEAERRGVDARFTRDAGDDLGEVRPLQLAGRH